MLSKDVIKFLASSPSLPHIARLTFKSPWKAWRKIDQERGRQSGRERQTDSERDRQTDRQTETGIESERETDRERETDTGTESERER